MSHAPVGYVSRIAKRKGVVAVQVAVLMTVIVGFTALSFDVGAMYNTKADLQRTADAAALAAASKLADYSQGSPMAAATALAHEYVNRNSVFGRQLALSSDDVEFGRAIYNAGTGSYDFQAVSSFPDAVRVRVRLTADSPNGEMPLYFARALGQDFASVEAEAIAMMVPRDIAIVADLSGSHNNDSELMNFQLTDVNLHEVWSDFPGGIDDADTSWNGDEFPLDPNGYSPQMGGPAWGYFKKLGFGTETVNSSYTTATDPGLIQLNKNQDWTDSGLSNYLGELGYSSDEIQAIMSGDNDSTTWEERTAVALGLARWDSGMPGGLWEQAGVDPGNAGNANDVVGGGEITWIETFGDRTPAQSQDIFMDYIRDYISGYDHGARTKLDTASTMFRYQFGVKTFMNYLLEKRTSHNQTPEFANTKTQPMQAVKESVDVLTNLLEGFDTSDQLSLEIYARTARHEVDLTEDFQKISDRLNEMQAAHYDSWTNIGGGIGKGIEELSSSRVRPTAQRMMILLTDGNANVGSSGQFSAVAGRQFALTEAHRAAQSGIRIYSVSVGADSDVNLMSSIARTGRGTHFHAEGSIDQYTDQLEEIFMTIGGARPVELIR